MDDLLNDKEQVELVKSWLKENGPWLAAGVLIGAAGLWGWNAWQAHKEKVAIEASTRYDQLIEAFNRNDRARGATLAEELRRDYADSPYADQADLAMARSAVDARELAKAVEPLTRVMNNSKDQELRLVARLRLARLQLAQGTADVALSTLSGTEPGAFAPRYAEARGDILLAKGDKAGALREYLSARDSKVVGLLDTDTLALKIGDLEAQGIAAPAAAAAAKPAAATAPAAKP